jgi:ATP-dependent helicase/nuclease subunit A
VPPAAARIVRDRSKRQRFSVTRLSGQIVSHDLRDADAELDGNAKPGGDKWLEPLGLGTLVHAVLERARFGEPNPVREWCELLAPIHMDENESLAAAEAQAMVEGFLASPRCAELAAAKSVKREIEFLLRWPLDAGDSDLRFLQGYIDCIYRDAAGGWHLLDFKTNQTAGKKVSHVAEPYGLQLAVYALALEQALGVRPVDLVLHFLREGKEHRFPWDDASRAAAIEQIDQAIATSLVC